MGTVKADCAFGAWGDDQKEAVCVGPRFWPTCTQAPRRRVTRTVKWSLDGKIGAGARVVQAGEDGHDGSGVGVVGRAEHGVDADLARAVALEPVSIGPARAGKSKKQGQRGPNLSGPVACGCPRQPPTLHGVMPPSGYGVGCAFGTTSDDSAAFCRM